MQETLIEIHKIKRAISYKYTMKMNVIPNREDGNEFVIDNTKQKVNYSNHYL